MTPIEPIAAPYKGVSVSKGRATTFYVYALKDPRSSPALPFYIGKGTGDRAQQHLSAAGSSPKDDLIRSIQDDGYEPLVDVLVANLDESDALRIEAELIAAYGTRASGGILTNVVTPSGGPSKRPGVTVPSGAYERAQIGLDLLLESVYGLVAASGESGITNADAVHALDLGSDNGGAAKDYLSYSLLGILMRERRVIKGNDSRYRVPLR